MQRLTARQYFEESLQELIEYKPFERITVREIAGNCGMTTRTFYNYFQDKYDLILWTYSSRFEQYLEENCGIIDFFGLFSYIADYALENRRLYLSALQDPGGSKGFMESVIDYSCHVTTDYIRRNFGADCINDSLDFSVRFFYQGGCHIGLEYLRGDIKMTKEQYFAYVQSAIPDNLKPYFELNTTCRKM